MLRKTTRVILNHSNAQWHNLFPIRHRRLSVLFFGSDVFSKACLKALYNNSKLSAESGKAVDKLGVVCLPEKQSKLPVKIFADKEKIPIFTYPEFPRDCKYDIGVVVSFGKLLPKKVIKSYKFGMINVHGSILPKWRGASPLAHTIMNGDKNAGITVMEIKSGKFDHGRVLAQSEVIKVKQEWTSEDLGIALEDIASKCLLKCLGNIELYLENAKEQTGDISYAPKITTGHSNISWEAQTAEEIYRKYKAFGFKKDFVLRTNYQEKGVKLQKMTRLDMEEIPQGLVEKTIPGDVHFDKKSKTIYVRCKDTFVGITKLVYGKPLAAQDFYNGSMQERIKQGEKIRFE
uniref:methionyl-tRNA formyltransferase, mitochondrial-like n=1 Tax=Styela clava TaxID=7725 RepID=UPI00193A934C|nr:methionyl-tRNA formyltransferase, mitochondrial-like [Styela clava]XP_039254671.1 methionyl-tRNA formyltransferase, mitochondrial-like [Styela clava]